ncbi:MAG TPA: hypothetical protein VF173_04990 [Thermoanaerobaculia bacterium]|nr:hypothetical protein [Thermoanaerobaculia bacterium]
MSLTIEDLYGNWFDARIVTRLLDPCASALELYDGADGSSYWHTSDDRWDGAVSFDSASGQIRLQGCTKFPVLTVATDTTGSATLKAGDVVLCRMDAQAGGDTCNLGMINKPQDG